jgi:hypothetical protein
MVNRKVWCHGCYPRITRRKDKPSVLCDWCLAWYGWIKTVMEVR